MCFNTRINLLMVIRFSDVAAGKNFGDCELSWLEQRNFTHLALATLQDHPVVDVIRRELLDLQPAQPDLTGACQCVVRHARAHSLHQAE